jgi:tetratricopeptide (TPR) repeat protein
MADDDLLQSWKEIAAYLGRSERTCRRWETEFRLPIHRMDSSVRGSVFAYKSELDRWMDAILHEKRRGPPPKKRLASRRTLIIALGLVVISTLAIAVVIWRGSRSEPQTPSSSTKPALAVLPFTNNTGDKDLDFWEVALADLLVSGLSQSRYVEVLSQDVTILILRDLGQLDTAKDNPIDVTEVAARARVDNIVFGSFTRAGRRFRVTATVRHIPTGESVVLPTVEARDEDEIFSRVDELSTQIKNHLVRPLGHTRRDLDLDLGAITTSSLEAYRYFVDGRSSWYRGQVGDAKESFERAVAIDPEFAMAHYWLSGCYFVLPGHWDKHEESLSRAFELSHHASPRERFHIQGQYFRVRGQRYWGKAIETLSEYLRIYPHDDLALQRLGRTYSYIEEWERCIETLERITDVRLFSDLGTLAEAHSALGQYETALRLAEGPTRETDSLVYRDQLVSNLIRERRFEAVVLEADRMLERLPGFAYGLMAKGDVHLYRAEWEQAEEYYRELLNPVANVNNRRWLRIDAFLRLAYLSLARGEFGRALDFIDRALDFVTEVGERRWFLALHYRKAVILLAQGRLPEADAEIQIALVEAEQRGHVTGTIWSLYVHGMMCLELGDIRGAEHVSDEMRAEIEGWLNPKLIRRWHLLAGHIEIARDNVGDAVAHFERAVTLLPHQHERNGDEHAPYYSSLGYAHYLSDDLGNAQEWYEKVLALTSGRLRYGDFYAKSHFMLGRIHQQRGQAAEAIKSYRTFLDLWQEADGQMPELEEARRSLAALLD